MAVCSSGRGSPGSKTSLRHSSADHSHKRCGSSHLNSHKSGKKIRRLRKKAFLTVSAEAHRVRKALKVRESTQPDTVEAARLAAMTGAEGEAAADAAAGRAENLAESAG